MKEERRRLERKVAKWQGRLNDLISSCLHPVTIRSDGYLNTQLGDVVWCNYECLDCGLKWRGSYVK